MNIAWAGELRNRAARSAHTMVLRTVPLRAFLEIAVLRARFHERYAVVPGHVLENLGAAFANEWSPKQIRKIAQRHMGFRALLHLQKTLLLKPSYTRLVGSGVSGLDELGKALDAGRGALLVSAHLGFPRLIGPILRSHGFTVSRVTTAPELPGDIMAGLDVRPVFGALARNEPVLILGDGMHAAQFTKLSLFGNDYPFPTGFLKIAAVAGAPILPVWCLPGDRRARIRLEIHPPLDIESGASLESNLGAFARLLESPVRQTPHLWARWSVPDFFHKAVRWSETDQHDRERAGVKWMREGE